MNTNHTRDWQRQRAAMQKVMREHPNATKHEHAIKFAAAVARQDQRKARIVFCLFSFFPLTALVLCLVKWLR